MRSVVTISLTMFLATLVWCGIEAALTLRSWRGVPDRVVVVAETQGQQIAAAADKQVSAAIARADGQLDLMRRDMAMRLDEVIRRADTRTGQALAILDTRTGELIQRADGRAGEAIAAADHHLSEVTGQTGTTTAAFTRVLTDIEPWFNCGDGTVGGGRDCFQNRAWWMTAKADTLMTSAAIWVPQYLETAQQTNQHINGMAADFHALTTRWTAPKRWYQHIWPVTRDSARIAAAALP